MKTKINPEGKKKFFGSFFFVLSHQSRRRRRLQHKVKGFLAGSEVWWGKGQGQGQGRGRGRGQLQRSGSGGGYIFIFFKKGKKNERSHTSSQAAVRKWRSSVSQQLRQSPRHLPASACETFIHIRNEQIAHGFRLSVPECHGWSDHQPSAHVPFSDNKEEVRDSNGVMTGQKQTHFSSGRLLDLVKSCLLSAVRFPFLKSPPDSFLS